MEDGEQRDQGELLGVPAPTEPEPEEKKTPEKTLVMKMRRMEKEKKEEETGAITKKVKTKKSNTPARKKKKTEKQEAEELRQKEIEKENTSLKSRMEDWMRKSTVRKEDKAEIPERNEEENEVVKVENLTVALTVDEVVVDPKKTVAENLTDKKKSAPQVTGFKEKLKKFSMVKETENTYGLFFPATTFFCCRMYFFRFCNCSYFSSCNRNFLKTVVHIIWVLPHSDF